MVAPDCSHSLPNAAAHYITRTFAITGHIQNNATAGGFDYLHNDVVFVRQPTSLFYGEVLRGVGGGSQMGTDGAGDIVPGSRHVGRGLERAAAHSFEPQLPPLEHRRLETDGLDAETGRHAPVHIHRDGRRIRGTAQRPAPGAKRVSVARHRCHGDHLPCVENASGRIERDRTICRIGRQRAGWTRFVV